MSQKTSPRKKIVFIFLIIYLLIAATIFFGLKKYSQQKFSSQSLQQLMIGKSKFRDITDNLCHYQILGEPKVGKNFIKINFWCLDGSKSRSTFALVAFADKTPKGILQEYARIINFDFNLIQEKNWFCTLNDQEISPNDQTTPIPLSSTVDCFQKKGMKKSD